MVSPLEFLLHNPAGQLLRLVGSLYWNRSPLLKVVVSPAPGNDHRAGEKQGRLDGDQVPPIEILCCVNMTKQSHHPLNLAQMFLPGKSHRFTKVGSSFVQNENRLLCAFSQAAKSIRFWRHTGR